MPEGTARTAILSGVIVVAATAGAVVGMGMRRGDALEPFMAVGRALLSTRELVPLPWLALAAGLVAHAAIMLALGSAFALATSTWGRVRLAVASALYAAVVGELARAVGPRSLGAYGTLAATRAEWFFLMALLAVALFAGTRASRVS